MLALMRTGLQVLRGMPALQGLPDRVFDVILAQGRLVRYDPNQVVWQPPQSSDQTHGGIPCSPAGIFVVAMGLIRWSFSSSGHPSKVSSSSLCNIHRSIVLSYTPGVF